MSASRLTSTIVTMLLWVAPLARAQSAGVAGHWEGVITAPSREIGIEVDLEKTSKGELIGTFGNPGDHLVGFPLSDVAVDGQSVRFVLSAGTSGGPFTGVLSADGKSIAGEFSATTPKGPMAVPFTLTRTGDAKIELPQPSASIGRELEGTWNGSIDVNGNAVHVVMKLANRADGTSAGTVATVGDGIDVPITTITQKGSAVTLDVKIVGGVYAGALNDERTELVGTWTQGSFEGQLSFRRASTEGPK